MSYPTDLEFYRAVIDNALRRSNEEALARQDENIKIAVAKAFAQFRNNKPAL